MEREVKHGILEPKTNTIVINKDGMRVEGEDKDFVVCTFISQAINCGGFKHSWHIDVGKAKRRGSWERKKIRSIIEEKIEEAESLIVFLKDAKHVLSKWK